MMTKKSYTFLRGWKALPNGKMNDFKNEILGLFGHKLRSQFYLKMRKVIRKDEYDAVTDVFARYGLKESEVWDEVPADTQDDEGNSN